MKAGRMETYMHSDSVTPNKCAAMVRALCDSDAAAKTEEFKAFAKVVAMMACSVRAASWDAVKELLPEIEVERVKLEGVLKEKVSVDSVTFVSL